jgi:predicted  nucleic acid-binding Zn-ribbon protein
LKRDRNSLPANLKGIDDSIYKLRSVLGSKRDQASEIEKTQRQAQAALDLNRDRLARANSKLEAVQNTQEFQAANKEIDQLKKLNASLEDQGKKTVTDLEALKKDLEKLEEDQSVLQQERTAKEAVVQREENHFKSSIEYLMAERDKFSSNVETRILAQYDRVRGARAGLGIVPAVGGRCKGCNMVVPPQLYNEVQRGNALHSCPSCHRLLFVPNPSAADAQKG